uniref:mitochondrial processing peptidase n=2 Tax=Polytomella TaxID=3049 RepID=A0A7S0V6E6_9CHLO|nr:ubiquinol:cytochrome c oxidoreductase 50 kDa core 1 subunit [Polytomella sp. Pringsheim 198.80]|mmetsp:Transcript_29054/g.53395  ORF Transcript_29054/g.53395 Transcript_29054/m.53395 type:complete len:495 (+) Transcript_29054:102-1586(+)
MKSLTSLVRQQQDVCRFAARAFASHAVAAPSGNPFLRYANPFPAPVDHSALLATLPETKVTTLPNGLRVATENIPFAETATVGVWINSGSRFENDANNGTAHFLEHLLFKGTQKRTVRDLEVEVENMGGQLNAYTGREQTCYYAKVMGKDVPNAINILSDILLNSKLDEQAINRERSVILREMEEVNKQTHEKVFDHLHATAFQHSPLGRTILGPEENIRSITRDDLVQYIKTHYRGPRMVLAAAGAVDHDALVKLAESAFGTVSDEDNSTAVRSLISKEPSLYTGSYVHDRYPDATECAIAIAFKGASWTDPDSIPLMVLQTMLGGWDKNSTVGKHSSSDLVQRVAAEGLADSFMTFNTNYHDTGLFGVYGVTDRDRCNDYSYYIMNHLTKTAFDVEERDVVRAKNQLKASLLLYQDSTHHVAESIGRELLVYGRRVPKAELFARIDAVDPDTIRAVADRFIYDQDPVIASVGDVQFMPDYQWFRRKAFLARY